MDEVRLGHGTHNIHGTRPAAWSDALRDARPAPPPAKHCWFAGPHGRQAALLLEWRRVGEVFHGRIAVSTVGPDGWAVTEMWVEQGLLSPVR